MENEFNEVSHSRFQEIWNKKLYAGGHYHPKDVVLDSFKIFLVLRKPRADNSKAATASYDRVCQIKAANFAFWMKKLETISDIELSEPTSVFEA